MSSTSGISINQPGIRQLDLSKLKPIHLSEATDNIYNNFVEGQERFLKAKHTNHPDTSSHPAYQTYATVISKGKVVATIDNYGGIKTSNTLGSKINSQLPGSVNGTNGPDLAQARAEIIADVTGGRIEKSATAISQNDYNNLPSLTPTVDYAALKADPLYQNLQKLEQARTEFHAQQLAQEIEEKETSPTQNTTSAETTEAEQSYSKATQAFIDYMEKTPEERYFEDFLESKDLTEEEFKKLTPEEQQDLLAEFEDYLKQRFGVANNSNGTSSISVTA